jgi:hypothetical protein
MPVQVSYPGVYIEELPSGVRTITGVSTSITAFVGWAPQGPTDAALRLSSWADYDRYFGGLHADSAMSYAVYHFYQNGGQQAYIVRVVAEGAAAASVTVDGLTLSATGPGLWAESYGVQATPHPEAGRFGLRIVRFRDATQTTFDPVEDFTNLSMDRNDRRYVALVLNEESLIVNATVDDAAAAPAAADAPVPLGGAVDGDVLSPDSADFWTAAFPTDADENGLLGGVFYLDRIDLFNLLCVPGLVDRDNLAALAQFCRERRAFLIADGPNTQNSATVQPIAGEDGINAAIYYPWLRAADPMQEGRLREFPPSGAVAGVYARTDAQRGVWKAPAGTDASLSGVNGLTAPLTNDQNGALNQRGVNCLRVFPVFGPIVWGARTCRGDDQLGSEWKYVPVRRLTLFIEESLYRGLQWVVFEPNDEPLWAQIRLNAGAFMNTLFRQGAFQGSSPRDAYFVKCDKETTTQADINRGVVNVIVGFAPLKPAEFVIVKIQQMAGQLQV